MPPSPICSSSLYGPITCRPGRSSPAGLGASAPDAPRRRAFQESARPRRAGQQSARPAAASAGSSRAGLHRRKAARVRRRGLRASRRWPLARDRHGHASLGRLMRSFLYGLQCDNAVRGVAPNRRRNFACSGRPAARSARLCSFQRARRGRRPSSGRRWRGETPRAAAASSMVRPAKKRSLTSSAAWASGRGQPVQGLVEGEQVVVRRLRRRPGRRRPGRCRCSAAAVLAGRRLRRAFSTRMRRMASAAAAKKWPRLFQCWRLLDVHQPQVGLVDQGRGLERLARLLLGQLLRRPACAARRRPAAGAARRRAGRPARWRTGCG